MTILSLLAGSFAPPPFQQAVHVELLLLHIYPLCLHGLRNLHAQIYRVPVQVKTRCVYHLNFQNGKRYSAFTFLILQTIFLRLPLLKVQRFFLTFPGLFYFNGFSCLNYKT